MIMTRTSLLAPDGADDPSARRGAGFRVRSARALGRAATEPTRMSASSAAASQLCARNTWIRDPSGGEAVGDVLVLDVSPKSGDVLKGTAYDPKRKLGYSMTISASKDKLDTRGCIVGGLICKTVKLDATAPENSAYSST